ncbi:MAG: tetratricopeptide repeat protein [Flavobacteriales bacterium]|nr:tetratricopeptide repeat protein [Flavobacteriales bacterium]
MQLFDDSEEEELPLAKFESMLKTNKILFFDSEEFEGIIIHYLDQGKVSLAKKALKLALDQHPHSFRLKMSQVDLYIYSNKFDQADKLLNELQAIEPTNEETYIQRANIFSRRNDHESAVKQLEIAIKLTDDPADIYSFLGMEYLYLDDVPKAKQSFIDCLNHNIEDYSALFNAVYCFDFLEEHNEAILFLNEYIDKNPYSEYAWHQLGKEYYTLKKYKKAIRAFDYAILIDERFVGGYIEKAKSLEKLNSYKEAIACYQVTLSLDDPTPFALLRIGKCYENIGDAQHAIEYYLRAITEDPLFQKAWLSIIRYYFNKKNYSKALHYTNKALSTDKDNAKYWVLYAQANGALQFYEEAIIGYNNALEKGNFKLKSWFSLCDTLIKMGEYATAIDSLEKCNELYPNNDLIFYRLAGLCFLLQDNEKSIHYLKEGLQINEKHINILANLLPLAWNNPKFQKIIKDL